MTNKEAVRSKKIIRASLLGILMNLLLSGSKAVVGYLSNSIAITLDALNNLSDAVSSVITIIGLKLSERAPDKEHPYGHGRIEYITASVIAIIVIAAGISAFTESINKIRNPVTTSYSLPMLLVIVAAIIAKYFYAGYVKKIGKKLKSESLIASGTDAYFDAVLAAATLVAALMSMYWHINNEGFIGLIISVVIIKAGVDILRGNASSIIGERSDRETTKKVKDTINSFPNVYGTYDVSLHNYGPNKTVGSAHIEIPEDMTAKQIHGLSREIEDKVYDEYNILLTLGIYATNHNDPVVQLLRSSIEQLVATYPDIKEMHGFYMNTDDYTVTFDIVLDFDCKISDKIQNELNEKLTKLFPEYIFDIIVDADLTE